MFDTFDNCKWIENFEIDNDVSPSSISSIKDIKMKTNIKCTLKYDKTNADQK